MAVLIWGAIILIMVALKYYCNTTMGVCKSKKKLFGKTAMVIGAETGIGYYTGKDLASRGARLIITGKNESYIQKVREELIQQTGNRNIVAKYLDLRSLDVVRSFAKDILENEDKLHILVNNAGIAPRGNKYSDDGLLIGLQINYFGHFLLTNLLADLMKKSAPSRIINVCSVLSFFGYIYPDNINSFSGYIFPSIRMYSNSKRLFVYFTYELADRLKGSGVTVNCLHPGIVDTQIFNNWYKLLLYILFLGKLYLKSPEQGAQTSIHLAVSDEVEGITGRYFVDCKPAKYFVPKDFKIMKKVWEESVKLVKLSSEKENIVARNSL